MSELWDDSENMGYDPFWRVRYFFHEVGDFLGNFGLFLLFCMIPFSPLIIVGLAFILGGK